MNNLMGLSKESFKLKASLFTLTTLHLFNTDIVAIQQQLKSLIEQTPNFFQQLPIILDLSALQINCSRFISFTSIINCLRSAGIIPIGIRGGNAEQQTLAIQAGLSVLPNVKLESIDNTPKPSSQTAAKLVTQPVRSGQQIYAKNGDLIVLASISPGAELLADGNIHIYGRLKGRALAGVSGNQDAHIFCKHLEAELVAIAGNYWLSEDLCDLKQRQPLPNEIVQISLYQERLQIKTLG